MSTSLKPCTVVRRSVAAPRDVADLLRRLARQGHPALLDSSGGPARLARWSLWAFDPFQVLSHDGRTCSVTDRRGCTRPAADNPFTALREELGRFALPPSEDDVPLRAGAIGFLSYELGRYVERLPRTVAEDIALPLMHWAFYDSVLAVDHHGGKATLWATDHGGRDPQMLLDRWQSLLAESETQGQAAGPGQRDEPGDTMSLDRLACNFTPASYRAAVARAIEYIAAGDIFQVNLSQRFTAPLPCEPVELYLRLRTANPAPFAAYLSGGDGQWAVLSSSPERFLRVADRHVETRPIKGTRPRRLPGDAAIAAVDIEQANRHSRDELLASEKDAAELAMIVDLERNDLGRVCSYGSIHVTEPRTVEPYASVFHTVAQVEGRLHDRYDLVDLLKATFPGGSITGAPKVRAMEIIDELEPTARSVYTGSVGYVGFDGRMDLNIAIRTLLADGPRVHVQVGGGIVADSTPEAEYDETLAKGRRMLEALGVKI
ncbi:MAG: anthranilate synthase component I family protein [Pirellulales bacterium]|nr:anthranilate synthase component I family protein [Pirellulales bacterium]